MGFLNVIVNENLYDQEFVQKWSNLVGLVREDNGVMLTEYALRGEEPEPFHGPPFAVMPPEKIVVWNADTNTAVIADGRVSTPRHERHGGGQTGQRRNSQVPHSLGSVRRAPERLHARKGGRDHLGAEREDRGGRPHDRYDQGLGFAVGRLLRPVGLNSSRATQAAMMLVALTGDLDCPAGWQCGRRQLARGWLPRRDRAMGCSGNVPSRPVCHPKSPSWPPSITRSRMTAAIRTTSTGRSIPRAEVRSAVGGRRQPAAEQHEHQPGVQRHPEVSLHRGVGPVHDRPRR